MSARRCHGSGEIAFNPSPINDPQCEDSLLCGGCPDCEETAPDECCGAFCSEAGCCVEGAS